MSRPLTEGERLMRKLELSNLILALVAIVAVHVFAGAGPMLWGTLVGGLIGVLNLRAMIFLGKRLLASQSGKRHVWGLLFTAKLVVLSSIVWLVLSTLPLDSIGFLIGFSTLLPASLVTTFIRALERSTPGSDPAAGSALMPGATKPTPYGERRP